MSRIIFILGALMYGWDWAAHLRRWMFGNWNGEPWCWLFPTYGYQFTEASYNQFWSIWHGVALSFLIAGYIMKGKKP